MIIEIKGLNIFEEIARTAALPSQSVAVWE